MKARGIAIQQDLLNGSIKFYDTILVYENTWVFNVTAMGRGGYTAYCYYLFLN